MSEKKIRLHFFDPAQIAQVCQLARFEYYIALAGQLGHFGQQKRDSALDNVGINEPSCETQQKQCRNSQMA